MAQVGSLVIDLIAETASFNANIKRASQQLNSEATKMNASLASINKGINSVVNAGKALVAFELGQEIGRIAKAGLDYASSLGEVSQQLGVTSDDLQVYRYAATQVGLSQEEMDTGLQRLTRTLGQAQLGSKQTGAVFAALDVDLRTASGSLKTTSQIIPEVAQALSRIPDPARRAALETQLFGRAGQKLDTLLAGGSDAIDNLRNAAHRLGIVLSDRQIQQADETADKLAEVKMVLEARVAAVVAENAGAIFTLADAFEAVTVAAGKGVKNVTDMYRGIALYRAEKGRLATMGAFATDPEELRQYGRVARFREALANDNGPAPAKSFLSGGTDIDNLLGGGGGGKSRSVNKIREIKSEADKLNETLAELRDQNNQALENVRLPYEIGGADDPLLKALKTEDYFKELRELSTVNQEVTKQISNDWQYAARDVLGSLQSLSYGISNGGFLDILGGVVDVLLSLGGTGLFKRSTPAISRLPQGSDLGEWASGGYTGSAGVDEIAGFVHGKEYVFDAQAVRRIGIENLERLRKGYKNGGYVGTMPAAMSRLTPANRVSFDLRGAVMTTDLLAQMNAMATGAAMRGAVAGSEDAQRTIASRSRRRLPGR
jgi:hypothetical protein